MSRDRMRLVSLFTIVAAFSGSAQTLPTACEASAESHEVLERWRAVYDDTRVDLQERLEPLRNAIAEHPNDIFLHHRYQDYFDSYMTSVLSGPGITRYREALAKNPESELHRYLLGRILWGRSTAEGFALIKGVSERNPDFAWAHLTLARYYEHTSLRRTMPPATVTWRAFANFARQALIRSHISVSFSARNHPRFVPLPRRRCARGYKT